MSSKKSQGNHSKYEETPNYSNYLKETKELGSSRLSRVIELHAKRFKVINEKETKQAIAFTGGYYASYFSAHIYADYIFPLIDKIRKYYYMLIASSFLLIVSILIILANVKYNTIKIFIFIILPALIGIGISILKGFKIWSEAKKNLAEAKKIEMEIEN